MVSFPQLGDRFADTYEIGREIGRGGFSTVLSALELETGRAVALKILRPTDGVYDGETIRRFERELKVLSRLHDPHTVRLLDSGQTGGLLWAAFERIPGRDLSEMLGEEGRLSVTETSHVLRQVLLSLREAHNHGLLHRDLKPENLRVFHGPAGPLTVKVIDFGIARSSDAGHPSMTKTGELIGTPRYMSPEQLRGADLDARSDLYTLGLIGLELIAGREVLGGNRLQHQLDRMRRDVAFDVPALGDDREGARLHAVLTKLIATAPERRFQTAAEVLTALAAEERASLPIAPQRSRSLQGAVVVGLGVAVTAGLWFTVSPSSTKLQRPSSLPEALLTASSTPPPQAPDSGEARDSAAARRIDPALYAPLLYAPFEGARDFQRIIAGSTFSPTRSETRRVYVVIPANFDPENAPKLLLVATDGELPADDVLNYFDVRAGAAERNMIVVVPVAETADLTVWSPKIRRSARADIAAVRNTLGLEDAPLLALGEGNGAQGIDHLNCDGLRFAAAVKTGYGYKRLDQGTPVHRRCFAESVPRTLMFVQLQDRSRPADGVDCDGVGWIAQSALQDDAVKLHGCAKDSAEPFGSCMRWACETALETCTVDGGRNWRSPAWGTPKRAACVGPIVTYPYTDQTWSFFDRMTASF